MSDSKPGDGKPGIEPEQVEAFDPARIAHLATNRGVIVRRSLLATAMGAVIPVPVMDEYVSGRVRAGLLMRLAEQRKVDLPQSAAELMADPKESSSVRHATLTAMTLVALRLAWRKFFALLAAGRGAEEMASTFQFATLFDHYCAKIHVGSGIDRKRAYDLRVVIHDTVERTEKAALVAVFRDGGRVLGRSLLEAPRWLTTRLGTLAQRWVSTRGNPEATFDPTADLAPEGETQWLDRASETVEARLGSLGTDYLGVLIGDFERRWAALAEKLQSEAAAKAAAAETPPGAAPPPGPRSGSN
jgi:hypothetical protein